MRQQQYGASFQVAMSVKTTCCACEAATHATLTGLTFSRRFQILVAVGFWLAKELELIRKSSKKKCLVKLNESSSVRIMVGNILQSRCLVSLPALGFLALGQYFHCVLNTLTWDRR